MSASDPQPLDDMKLVKTEQYDANMMVALSLHEGVSNDVKRLLKSYRGKRQDGNKVQIVYEYGKDMKVLQKGRIYPQKGCGLQSFPSDVRAALASKYYWDIDIANAQPVILVALCKQRGWKCDKLEEYVLNRAEKLEELMSALQCDRDDAKQFCLSILFGAKPYQNVPDYFIELADEISLVAKNCQAANSDIAKVCTKKPKPLASCLAHWVQTEESKVLRFIDSFLAIKGRGFGVLIHDGGLVLKLEGESCFPHDLLREIEVAVEDKFGFRITMAQKPMEHSFEVSSDPIRGIMTESQYQVIKATFEETRFYCMETSMVCEVFDDRIRQTSKSDGAASFAAFNPTKIINNEHKTQCFFNEWISDPKKRTMERFVFHPKECAENEYNLYRGMMGSQGETVNAAIVDRFKMLLLHNANKDAVMNEYMTKWFALLVQKPWVIPGVVLIFVNSVEGTGKDTLCDFIGNKVVGKQYYQNIKNAKDEVFEKHSMARERSLFMKFEEANGYDNRQFSDMLKSLVTSGSANINPKGVKPYAIDTFPHLVMTTNNEVPVKIGPNDRRFCITNTSSDFVGQTAFWNETYDLLGRPEAGHSVWKYLMGIDLTGFEATNFPKNAYHEALAVSEVSPDREFLNQLTELEECSGSDLHSMYVNYCRENLYTHKSIVWFCRCLAGVSKIKMRMLDGKRVYWMDPTP